MSAVSASMLFSPDMAISIAMTSGPSRPVSRITTAPSPTDAATLMFGSCSKGR